jgi:hypothetical protein
VNDFKELYSLPGTAEEKKWLADRLETLTVKEALILTAAQMRHPADTAADAVRQLCSLPDYTLIGPAKSYEELGKRYLEKETRFPRKLYECADLDKLGRWYEDTSPGLFVGDHYVAYPKGSLSPSYDGTNLAVLEDADWSVKLKLASDAVPEGVWLRLPDYERVNGDVGEISLALEALQVRNFVECTLLEARCILLGIINLTRQYDDVVSLIYDGQNLGVILDEQGQGTPFFREKVLAALEYEGCRLLVDALDICQNLDCYDCIPTTDFAALGKAQLQKSGVLESIVEAGCFDLEKCGSLLMEDEGYITTGNGYCIRRNEKPFQRLHEEGSTMTMTMTM